MSQHTHELQLSLWISQVTTGPPGGQTRNEDQPCDLKAKRRHNNKHALKLISSGAFDREEVFRLYTGVGGLLEKEEGENFLAASHEALGQYFTPASVTRLMVDMLSIPKGARVLDNTCGHGAMFWHLPQGCYATGIEFQEEACIVAGLLFPGQTIIQGDCLEYLFENQFHYALLNPPFGLNWKTNLKLDLVGFGGKILSHVACLELAVRAVVPSGYLAVILPKGSLKRPDMVSFRRWYRDQTRIAAEIDLPKETFKEQGAEARTTLLVMRKLPAPDRPMVRLVVRPNDLLPANGSGDEGCFARVRNAWFAEQSYADALAFAAEIPDLGPVESGRRNSLNAIPIAKKNPADSSSTEGLLLKKGRYSVIPCPGDIHTALKLAEIREVRCAKDHWCDDDPYQELMWLSAFYTSTNKPKFLDLLEAYQINWQYDTGLAHWIARKRRRWQRQQFVYQTYSEPPKIKKKRKAKHTESSSPSLQDHIPDGYGVNRRKLDLLGLSPFLFEYQQMDAARLACKPFNALLYDMGLGKTRTSIATALIAGSRRVLIICLSRLVKVWTDELAKLGIDSVAVIRSVRDVDNKSRFTIVSYEKLSRQEAVSLDPLVCPSCGKTARGERCICGWRRTGTLVCPQCRAETWSGHSCRSCGYVDRVWIPSLVKRLRRLTWGMIVVDESQMMKTKNSLRSQAVSSLKAKRKLLLTGTLIKGYVPDMFWQLHWCFGGGSPGFPYPWRGGAKRFISQFATYEYVSDEYQDRIQGKKKMVPKVNNLPAFWQLMGPKVIRRLVDDPLVRQSIQLPTKDVKVIMVEMDVDQKAVYDWWYENFVEWYKEQLELEERDANYTMKNAAILGQLWKLRQAATCPHIFTGEDGGPAFSGKLTNKHKALNDILENIPQNDKAVIFTGYNPNALLISGTLEAPLLIGSTPIDVRNEVIEEFQKEPEPKVLVAGLLAMNLGQTLTRANHALMTDLDWCPSSMVQAEGRLLRISQEQSVQVTYLLCKGTIDEDMYELLYQKQAAINEAIDHKTQTEKVHPLSIRDFVNEMLRRKEHGK